MPSIDPSAPPATTSTLELGSPTSEGESPTPRSRSRLKLSLRSLPAAGSPASPRASGQLSHRVAQLSHRVAAANREVGAATNRAMTTIGGLLPPEVDLIEETLMGPPRAKPTPRPSPAEESRRVDRLYQEYLASKLTPRPSPAEESRRVDRLYQEYLASKLNSQRPEQPGSPPVAIKQSVRPAVSADGRSQHV